MDINELLTMAVQRSASDIHLKVPARPILRIHGELILLEEYPELTSELIQRMLQDITTDIQRKSFYDRWELDFSYSIPNVGRFRVNACMQRGSVALALRTVPIHVTPLAQLGMPDVCRTLATKPNGMVLVTGATGSGKSTTLAGMIDHINETERRHIVTIEDPIEFLHTDKKSIIAQREIGADTTSYPEALRHVLRQDPDVILIGEMRDLETISTAITAAETGHLVLATLHTTSAPQTIDRIIDVFPPEQQGQIRLQLSVALEGVITMTLLPRAAGQGRVAAVETLIVTSAVRNLIREGKTFQIGNLMQMGAQYGSQTMDQALKSLVDRRLVAPEDALARASNSEELRRLLQGAVTGAR